MEKKRTIKFIAFALAALVLFGVGIAAWATKCFGAFESQTVQQEPGAGGMVLGECEGKGIRLTGTAIARADYGANEVSPLAETAYTITVTPTPADAHDTYAWTSTDDESVKLTPSNGGKTCKVECLKAFGTQITLTCTQSGHYGEPDGGLRQADKFRERIPVPRVRRVRKHGNELYGNGDAGVGNGHDTALEFHGDGRNAVEQSCGAYDDGQQIGTIEQHDDAGVYAAGYGRGFYLYGYDVQADHAV